MACRTCIAALQQGGRAVQELAVFRPDLLPEITTPITTWEELAALLIAAAGQVRQDLAASNPTP